MKQRIEFTAFVDVHDDEPLTADEARGWVETALLRGGKHASEYVTTLDEVTFVSQVRDDE
ncbi:hypothetical protein [Streptomyces scopuliridis]|uniref:Uncharacterized protein n=1 Tax=Streptomyces scopuliridis TaxID=452529 RepID=A0ACD4ZSR0_9ACTN|nr:hypothetical protein [Streptomyces scopuliridis]WSC01255.1 hypothetical protein OG835_32490 [Streptomyces scopuliridis]